MYRRKFIQKLFSYSLLIFSYSSCTKKTLKPVEESDLAIPVTVPTKEIPSQEPEQSGAWVRTNSIERSQIQEQEENNEVPGPWEHLYIVQKNPNKIVQLDFPNLNRMNSLVELDESVSGLVIHAREQKLYWTEGPTIQSANLDGSRRELIFVSRNPDWSPRSLAILPSENKLYWIYRDLRNRGRAIGEVRTNGQGERTFLELKGNAQELLIHERLRKIFWTEQSPDQIYSADLAGGNIKKLTKTINPNQIVLDEASEKLYWNDRLGLRRMNLEGSKPELLGKTFYQPRNLLDIEIDGFTQKLYWCNGKQIFQGDLDGNILRTLNIPATLLRLG